jgi:hypothetical protein
MDGAGGARESDRARGVPAAGLRAWAKAAAGRRRGRGRSQVRGGDALTAAAAPLLPQVVQVPPLGGVRPPVRLRGREAGVGQAAQNHAGGTAQASRRIAPARPRAGRPPVCRSPRSAPAWRACASRARGVCAPAPAPGSPPPSTCPAGSPFAARSSRRSAWLRACVAGAPTSGKLPARRAAALAGLRAAAAGTEAGLARDQGAPIAAPASLRCGGNGWRRQLAVGGAARRPRRGVCISTAPAHPPGHCPCRPLRLSACACPACPPEPGRATRRAGGARACAAALMAGWHRGAARIHPAAANMFMCRGAAKRREEQLRSGSGSGASRALVCRWRAQQPADRPPTSCAPTMAQRPGAEGAHR